MCCLIEEISAEIRSQCREQTHSCSGVSHHLCTCSSCQPECLNLLTLLSQAPCKISSHPRTEKPSAFPLSPCMRACAFQDPHAHRVLFSVTAVQAARQSPIHPGWLLFSRQDGGRSRGFFWGRWWKCVPSLTVL